MERRILVYLDLDETPVPVGWLWVRVRRGRESASFTYDPAWLDHPRRFALEPALAVGPGPFHTREPLFGSIGDSAPDRWGRVLLRRAEVRRAQREGRTPRTLTESDVLLRVDDEVRMGALRFSTDRDGPFLAEPRHARLPPLVELGRLLDASVRVGQGDERDEDLRLLVGPGSSLGGARPKAAVRDGASVAGQRILLLRRFDRDGVRRVHFLSAMSMLGAGNREPRSYLEIADALRRHGVAAKRDLVELWRRVVFSVLISNTDDHLRNHGFLYDDGQGWRLSPAYDLNPTPTDIRPQVLRTYIDEHDGTASVDRALATAEYYGLDLDQAKRIAGEVGRAVVGWRAEAAGLGASAPDIARMESAFASEDLEMATRFFP
ncbi:type II toxin-antitoxin system HipA family toxin [Candidatus Palauibacter sp.]|uniref:type II toxin-antitoxin system HipA family toxin n=1 Tax=Candidatus Palauibacter sp. TaxID=3101350 RepID=UPI003B58D3CB